MMRSILRGISVKTVIISVLTISILLSSCFTGRAIISGRKVHAAEATGMLTGKEIFSENFDAVDDGKLPDGWSVNQDLKTGGSAEVKDGELIIDASAVELGKVLLPEKLSEYGDYSFEADIRFISSRDENRWMSMIVRQQSEDQKYYHMCVRRKTSASNGVEFAERSPGAWNVMITSSGGSDIGLEKTAHVKISVVGDVVYEYINDKLIITTDSLSSIRGMYTKGIPAIQANYSVIHVDNVKVSECSYVIDPEVFVDDKYMSHTFAVTPVISRAATISVADSAETIDRVLTAENKPDNMILYIGDGGKVVSPDGKTVIGDIGTVTDKVFRKAIPVYYVKTDDAASELRDYLKSSKLIDCILISDRPEIIKELRRRLPKISGAIDYSGIQADQLTQEKLDEIIYSTNENSAKIALIPEKYATKANVEYMQHRLITVWVAESAGTGDDAMLHNSIQSGANGIVTDTPEALIDAYSFYRTDPAVLVRNPMVIGHRGLPSSAPENTVESAKEAIAAGVDCIELDVRLSSDGKLYLYHDADLSSLTTGKGTIGSHTSKELDSIFVTKSSAYGTFSKYKKVKLPSFDDYFAALKDEDVMFFIEIKEENLEEKVAEIVEKYNMKNKCCMISFVNSAVTGFPKAEPGMSVGQLMGTPSGSSYESKVKSIISTVVPENATFNASGVNDTKMIRALMYRGVTSWPWTYNHTNTRDAYLLGAGGITTDFCNNVSYVPTVIDIGDNYSFTLNPTENGKDAITFYPAVYNRMGMMDLSKKYSDGSPAMRPEIVILEGADHVKVNGDTVTALSDGTVRLMYRLLASTDPDKAPSEFGMDSFVLYTQVVTVNIDSGADVDPGTLPTPSDHKKNDDQKDGSITRVIVISAICAAVIGVCCILLAIRGKKKEAGKKD